MKPAPFDYIAPATVSEVVALLQEHEDEAKILAGGQSLVPLLNMRFARPELLIDLAKVDGLKSIREVDGAVAIGAMTTKREVEDSELVRERHPMLHTATRLIAHPQIRNRGTIGGSIAQADPAAEYPALAIVLGARMTIVGPEGERVVEAADFFITYLTTSLEPNELLTEVRFPLLSAGTGWSFQEIARRHGDFAMTGIAATLALKGGRCAEPRIVLFGLGAIPFRARNAEALLEGQAPGDEFFAQAAKKVNEEIEEPLSDVHAPAEYRRQLADVLTRRALAEAAQRAGA